MSEVITDTSGRSLSVQKLTMLEELDLLEAAGQASEVRRWLMMATMCAVVRGIQKPGEELVPCVFPRSKEQVRKHVALVDNAGLEAVIEWLQPKVSLDDEDTVAVAKN